ncbi:hypothetical protein [Sphingomonas sp. 1P08PE]|uniref:hypothetical protein n=1 Tax=Sphingomonas sp. 1P08PE TaxID=554122 RepID=UPI00399FFE92
MSAVSAVMAAARDPWWVIGSAAVALYVDRGIDVRDVDVLLSVRDIESLATGLRLTFADADDDRLFRSTRFLRWSIDGMPVEFMAGFAINRPSGWRPVELATREEIDVAGAPIFIPARAELRAMLIEFGREKDLARAALM